MDRYFSGERRSRAERSWSAKVETLVGTQNEDSAKEMKSQGWLILTHK